jgi:23S rRNA (guanosine2251-2'-O)-methyltransferase
MKEIEEYNDQVEGRNAVKELLNSGKDINKIFVAKGEKHGSIFEIIAKAKERKIVINEIEKNKLDKMAQSENHQGVIAIVPPYEYSSVDEILEYAKSKNAFC